MEKFILFLDPDKPSVYTVRPITEKWHQECNNFKGSYEDCVKEGKKEVDKALRKIDRKNSYKEPHYSNAAYGSIWDY